MVDNIQEQEQEFVVVEPDVKVVGGEVDHSKLENLDYEHAGHTGFASSDDIPTKLSELDNDEGFITTETDPVFSASASASITSNDISNWNGKSDFSGSYNDLTDKPTIPTNNDFTLNGLSEKSYNNLTDKPTIPEPYTLPTASDEVLGGVKVGDNLSIDENGVLSASGGGGGGGDIPIYYWNRTNNADSKAFLTELVAKYRNGEPFVLFTKYLDTGNYMNVMNPCILALAQNINGDGYIYEICASDSIIHKRHNIYVDNYNVISISINNTTISAATESWTNTFFLGKYNTSSYTPSSNYNPATKKYVDDAIAQLKSDNNLT